MAWYAAALAISMMSGPQPAPAGRILTLPWLHIGVRPALDVEKSGDWGLGVTVQVRARLL